MNNYSVQYTLWSLDSTKATGIDDLHPEIYKSCALSLLLPICHLFAICMESKYQCSGRIIVSFLYTNPVTKLW